jgi:hypothetical protein
VRLHLHLVSAGAHVRALHRTQLRVLFLRDIVLGTSKSDRVARSTSKIVAIVIDWSFGTLQVWIRYTFFTSILRRGRVHLNFVYLGSS